MNIAIGADHRGFAKKELLVAWLQNQHHIFDVGCFVQERCDYPLFAQAVARKIQKKQADVGILLCGSGVGMSIAANRFSGIYAALVWNEQTARLSKEHDNANILVIPADFITDQEMRIVVQEWLQATFLYDRYQERLALIDEL